MLVKKLIFIFLVSTLCVGAKEFRVASYNVENLFDLQHNKSDYKEYQPNTLTWNRLALQKKVKNISQVINELDADIVALQEVESQNALMYLLKSLPQYKYYKFDKKSTSSVGVAVISKYPIIASKKIDVDKLDTISRDILRVTIQIEDKKFVIYDNHWRSKRAKESSRIVYAMALLKDIQTLPKAQDYIIVGDLNSNYNECFTFKYDERLNDTKGITGINQILNTTIDENYVQKYNIEHYKKKVHYNTWLDLKTKDRFSTKFRGENNTPDNILLPKQLFDNIGIWYKDKNFYVFKPHYLYKNLKVNRWNIYKQKGYSDHLPIVATFSTSPQSYHFKSEKYLSTIGTLYNVQQIDNFPLKDIVVIYKRGNIVIVKHKDQSICSKAIAIFYPSKKFVKGGVYNFKVEGLDNYNGLQEIKKTSAIQKVGEIFNSRDYYLDGRKVDLHLEEYQNNIITHLTGIYKKGYLYYSKDNRYKKIKIYFKQEVKRPKDGKTITVDSGHLGTYRGKVQIVIYSNKDFY